MVSLVDVVMAWPGLQTEPLSVELGPGIHRFVGPNGAGKTTLLRGICADLPLASGQVRVLGEDPHTDASARAQLGFVPAHPDVPPFMTVDEAWRFYAGLRGGGWDGRPLCEALDLPGQLTLGEASSGQRRRAALVAALACDPPVLLLDETFAHLDDASVAVLCEWLEHWRASRCVLLVHHGTCPIRVDQEVAVRSRRAA